ncbi:hypothetical protein D1AOALGA4SA_9647 [Olavius algarvensis Delta 1 endosymbiont]|nr:hypothetical protein D1AOALGA4SA_9647 [Olavius algarvensis Delta 1 endosymbiont]
MKLHWNDECRMSIDEWWNRFRLRPAVPPDYDSTRRSINLK